MVDRLGSKDVKFKIKREKEPMVNNLNYQKIKPVNKSIQKNSPVIKNKQNNAPFNTNIQSNRPVNNIPREVMRKIFQKKHYSPQKNLNNYEKINESISQEHHNKISYPKIKIACILDAIPLEWFKYECTLLPLESKNWYNQIMKENPDILLVQSTWHDYKGDWGFKMIDLNKSKDNKLNKLVCFCKKKNIPTVFWNIEDPHDFNTFIDAAKLFDYIFTTDSNSINRYVSILKHNRIYTLPFAAQPKIHNPINKDLKKKGKIAFAGSWYNIGYDNRKKDMEIILKPALKHGVHIYDRMYPLTKSKKFEFPNIYQPYIKGYLPYIQMSSAYKNYNILLNVNTIQNSPTMFSCRIFELLASGINVVSGYSLGITKMFPDIVKISRSQTETDNHLNELLEDKSLCDRLSILGQRKVFSSHTYKHRIETIFDKIGINYNKHKEPGVTIVTSTIRENQIDNVFKNFKSQNYSKKELIIILNKNDMNIDTWKNKAKQYDNVKVYKLDENNSLGTCLNFAVDKAGYDYIAKFDDDDYYGPNYLIDIMNAFKYTNADIIGKLSYFAYVENSNTLVIQFPNKENQFTNIITGATLVCSKKVFDKIKFPTKVKIGTDTEFLKSCVEQGLKIYSADRFNYVMNRRASKDKHTWKVEDTIFLKSSKKITETEKYIDIVTV